MSPTSTAAAEVPAPSGRSGPTGGFREIVPDFTLPPEFEAHEPPEARGLSRDAVRLLVGHRQTGEVHHHRFAELPDLLVPGDLLVVNTSATLPAAVDTSGALVVHVSGEQEDGTWLVELREPREPRGRATVPYRGGKAGQEYEMHGGGTVRLLSAYGEGRLWHARFTVDIRAYMQRHGRPVRYHYVHRDWPLSAYQTVFAAHPGSAEMPSAGRPFTDWIVTRLATRGVIVAPITLHTGLASLEADETPYPEWYDVPPATARLVNATRAASGRVIAVGTTVVRALETAVRRHSVVGDSPAAHVVQPASGWTSLVVTPPRGPAGTSRGVHAVDGLLTGFHEPRASHLTMLEALAGHELLRACYRAALQRGYLWHEFGDVNLLLP